MLPFCNTAAMNLHLAEISGMVSPGKHAVLLLDQAGWHLSGEVSVDLSRIYAAPITRLGCLAFEGQGAFASQS